MIEPTVEVVQIGPTRARELLDHNENNRRLDWKLIDLYVRQMRNGEWTFVGDPIRVSTTGRLLDGQNRLHAIIMSETTQQFVMITNLPDASQTYMDVGKKRTAADVFTMSGVASPVAAVAIATLLVRYDAGRILDSSFKIGSNELLAYYGEHADAINRAARVSQTLKSMVPISPAVSGTVHVLACRVGDAFAVNAFFEGIRAGHSLEPGNPIAAARNWFIRRQREDLRRDRFEAMFILMRAWNAWAVDETMHRLILPTGGLTSSNQIPKLVEPSRFPAETKPTEDRPATTPYSRTRAELDATA